MFSLVVTVPALTRRYGARARVGDATRGDRLLLWRRHVNFARWAYSRRRPVRCNALLIGDSVDPP